jgi:hypothetical protein
MAAEALAEARTTEAKHLLPQADLAVEVTEPFRVTSGGFV